MESNWHTVWVRKGQEGQAVSCADRLRTLMDSNGYDTEFGGVSPADLKAAARTLHDTLRMEPASALLDIGCGSGALLYAMEPRPARVVGVDYSETSLELARGSLAGTFLHAEAAILPFRDEEFDGALSCGVYIYFPDLAYAGRALSEMVRVLRPGGHGALVDLMDVRRRDEREAVRRRGLTPEAHAQRYRGLEHLYLHPEWVEQTLSDLGCHCWPIDVFGPDYGYGRFAFHMAFERRA